MFLVLNAKITWGDVEGDVEVGLFRVWLTWEEIPCLVKN